MPAGEQVCRYAGAAGIDLVLVSNRDAAAWPRQAANVDEVDANLACLRVCRAAPRLAPLYWVRPGRLDSNIHAFAGALATEPFAGVVFAPAEGDFDAADPRLEPYLAVLAAVNRPAVFCVQADERALPAKVCHQAGRHAEVPMVLCLCGSGASERAATLDVACQARRRGSANLYLDTSHADAAEAHAAVRALGSDRVLFGSDALCGGDGHAARQTALLDALRKCLSATEFQQVAGASAARLFHLPWASMGSSQTSGLRVC